MAADPQLLTDLRLRPQPVFEDRGSYPIDTVQRLVTTKQRQAELTDLAMAEGRDNLAQAIILRLLTPRGELASLGHPEYGSRLHELLGEPNTEASRNRARLFILESLALEPRIQEVVAVVVETALGTRDRLKVRLVVQPIGATTRLSVGPFAVEL